MPSFVSEMTAINHPNYLQLYTTAWQERVGRFIMLVEARLHESKDQSFNYALLDLLEVLYTKAGFKRNPLRTYGGYTTPVGQLAYVTGYEKRAALLQPLYSPHDRFAYLCAIQRVAVSMSSCVWDPVNTGEWVTLCRTLSVTPGQLDTDIIEPLIGILSEMDYGLIACARRCIEGDSLTIQGLIGQYHNTVPIYCNAFKHARVGVAWCRYYSLVVYLCGMWHVLRRLDTSRHQMLIAELKDLISLIIIS